MPEIARKNHEELLARVHTLVQGLGFDDLLLVHQMITDRLRQLHGTKALTEMGRFRVGEDVSFNVNGCIYTGKVLKFNQKTITVLTSDCHHWNVSPHLLMSKVA